MFTERAARKIAPALLTCAALCFFLPFLGLSLATSDKAVGASATCDSGVLAYSGFDMIDGRAPSLNRDCGVNGAGGWGAENPFNIGIRAWAIAAFVLILLGVASSAARIPRRAVVAVTLSSAAGVSLLLNEAAVVASIKAAFNRDFGTDGGIAARSLLNFQPQPGFMVALGAVGGVVVYSIVSAWVNHEPQKSRATNSTPVPEMHTSESE